MKNIRILLLCLCLLLVPSLVKADAGGPIFTAYDVIVTNTDGTDLVRDPYNDPTNVKEHLEYKTIVKEVIIEEVIKGELYGYSQEREAYVKIADVSPNGELDFTKFENGGGKLLVFKEGAYLYKGPSKAYGKVDKEVMLPVGEAFEYKYSDSMFAYVTYKGTSGWVYIYQEGYSPYGEGEDACVALERKGTLHTIKEIYLYTMPEKGEKTKTLIPKGTDIKFNFSYKYNTGYYVEYKGAKGWVIDTVGTIDRDKKLLSHQKESTICGKIEEKCTDVLGKLPKNTIVPILYEVYDFDAWYYITYNGVSGYIYVEEYSDNPIYVSYKAKVELKNDSKLYTDIYGEETETVVEADKIIIDFEIYDNGNYESDIEWLHICEGNKTGWIKANYEDVEVIEFISEEDKDSKDDIINIPLKDLIIYSVIGAVVLAITTVVIIKLVNKNKDNKKETPNKE